MMNLRDLSIICGKKIEIKKSIFHPGWICYIENLEIKNDCILTSACGYGETKTKAMKDYAEEIQGKMIVTDAFQKTRKEFQLPEKISASVRK